MHPLPFRQVAEGDGPLPAPCGRQQQVHQAEQVVGNGAQRQVCLIGLESTARQEIREIRKLIHLQKNCPDFHWMI